MNCFYIKETLVVNNGLNFLSLQSVCENVGYFTEIKTQQLTHLMPLASFYTHWTHPLCFSDVLSGVYKDIENNENNEIGSWNVLF